MPASKYEQPKRSWYKRNEIAVTPILFLLPGVFFFAVYVIYPVFQSFNISLYKWDGLGEAEFIGLKNYQKLLEDRAFETSLWNNLKWLVLYSAGDPHGPLHFAVSEPKSDRYPAL